MNAMSGAAPRVTDVDLPLLDLSRSGSHEERLAILAELRAQHWLARMPLGYVVLRHKDVDAIHRDERFVNGHSLLLRRAGITDERFLAHRPNPFFRAKGEHHARLRRLVSRGFTPKGAERLRGMMRQVAEELLQQLATAFEPDMVKGFCEPLPTAVLAAVLGAPREDGIFLHRVAEEIFGVYGNAMQDNLERILAAHHELEKYALDLIEKRRRQPGDDVLTAMIAAEEAGDRLTTEELVFLTESLLIAGIDTTRNQLGLTIVTLLQHRDQFAELRGHPERIDAAVTETLRYMGAVGATMRCVEADTEYGGMIFPAGTLLCSGIISANHDPAVWPEPDRFLARRPPVAGGSLAFGAGAHFCLGLYIAKAEIGEAVRALVECMPGVQIAAEVRWKPYNLLVPWGLEKLPVSTGLAAAAPAGTA